MGRSGRSGQMPLRFGCPVQVEEVALGRSARSFLERGDGAQLDARTHISLNGVLTCQVVSTPGGNENTSPTPSSSMSPPSISIRTEPSRMRRDLPLLRGPRHRTLRRREAREPGPPRRDAPARASRFRARRGPVASRRSLPSIRTHQDASRDHPPSCGHATNHFAGGRTGIRTQERLAPPTVFKTVAFVRSAILPPGAYRRICPISRCGLGWLVRGGSDPSTAGGAR